MKKTVKSPAPPSSLTSLPVAVIVGRPNVGKSTLFNQLTRTRRSIVGDEPGITRDRIHGEGQHGSKRYELIDTGGIIPNDDELIPSEILKQARTALKRAAHILFVIDGRTEITSADRELAQMLHRLGKPVTLVVNKIDAPVREPLVHEFHELGFQHVFPVSAEHRLGLDDLGAHITSEFPHQKEDEEAAPATPQIRVAIIGRPNAGKSTLLNTLVGQERAIVSPVPGTTRDSVDESIVRDGVEFVFVDTAGIRRKGKTTEMAEKLAMVMARRAIEQADVVVVLIDAIEKVVGIDANIAGYAHEAGRPVILAVNKWDLATQKNKPMFVQHVRDELRYLDYAPVAFLSAKSGAGADQLFALIRRGYKSANQRVTTGELNRLFEHLQADRNTRIRYITQAGVRPPTFIVFKNGATPLHFSWQRHLINQLREKFGFAGTPIVIKSRTKACKPGDPRKK
ncbi:MAG: ribosome biogenesis GTPase Der [Acidobacteria bacterium]|nr:ribosome biogenesis GTPase Der [Acidobacteriota bacterium]